MMSFNVEKIPKLFIRFVEYIIAFGIAIIVFLLLIFFKDAVILGIKQGQLQLTNLGLAVFSWLALQVGFSFGVYAFVMSKNDGFIQAVKKTPTMRRFRQFLTHGYYSGMFVSFCTLPFIIVKPNLYTSSLFYYIMFALWLSSFIYAVCCFILTVRIFQTLQRAEDRKEKSLKKT